MCGHLQTLSVILLCMLTVVEWVPPVNQWMSGWSPHPQNIRPPFFTMFSSLEWTPYWIISVQLTHHSSKKDIRGYVIALLKVPHWAPMTPVAFWLPIILKCHRHFFFDCSAQPRLLPSNYLFFLFGVLFGVFAHGINLFWFSAHLQPLTIHTFKGVDRFHYGSYSLRIILPKKDLWTTQF